MTKLVKTLAILLAATALAQETTLTTSSSFSQTLNTTEVNRQEQAYLTRVVGRTLAGTVVVELSFDLPADSAEVTAAFRTIADRLRATPDVASVASPRRLSRTVNVSDPHVARERTRVARIIGITQRETVGPARIEVGSLWTAERPCGGYTGGTPLALGGLAPDDGFSLRFTTPVTPALCPASAGTPRDVPSGTKNLDSLTHIHTDLYETVTTTRTTLATEVYELVGSPAPAPPPPGGEDLGLQVRYLSNLDRHDAEIQITNSGARGAGLAAGTVASTTGAICVNVYAIAGDDQFVSCCSCSVTPNGLVQLSARQDLLGNIPTSVPKSLVVKLYPTVPVGGSCSGAAVKPGPDAPSLHAWATTLVGVQEGFPDITTGEFLGSSAAAGERERLADRCTVFNANGSGFGICRSCRLGGISTGRLP